MLSTDLQFWATVIYAASALILFLILLIVSYRVVRKLLKLFFGANSIFGNDGRLKLVTLGASALLFPEVLPALFIALVKTLSALLLRTSESLLNNWRANIRFCTDNEEFVCLSTLSSGFVQAFIEGLGNAFERISSIPVHRTILLFAIWAILSLIVSQAQQAEAESPGSSRIKAWFHSGYVNSGSPAFANVMFFLILAAGGYLSIAAITAIPGLQEKSAVFQEVGPERLKSQLEEALAAFNKYPKEIGTNDPFASLRAFLKTARADKSKTPDATPTPVENNQTAGASPTPTPSPVVSPSPSPENNTDAASVVNNPVAPGPTVTDPALDSVEMIANVWNDNRKDLLKTYSDLVDSVRTQLTSAKNIAVRSYEVGNLDRKGNKERVQYFLSLSDWFNQRSAEADLQLNNCLKSIQGLDASLQAWSEAAPVMIKNDSSAAGYYGEASISRLFRQAYEGCPPAIPLVQDPPRRPQLGESSYLGPFGFVASWLLRTESLPLALITGLLGFGLLGSACSTFVREQLDQRREAAALARTDGDSEAQVRRMVMSAGDGRLVTDLTGVVIRGLLAAVVVFLAVEGGLAIFASGGGEPNPYVLLLTCLIAAVFSEQVWRWAENKLADTLASRKKPDNDKAVADEVANRQAEQTEETEETVNSVEHDSAVDNVDEAPTEPRDISRDESSE